MIRERRVGNWRLCQLLDEVGFSEIYEARNLRVPDLRTVVKLLPARRGPSTAWVGDHFHEARALASLNHPNVIRLFDTGITEEGEPYLVMEYLDGTPLADLVTREGRLPTGQVAKIGSQVADALGAIHDMGIIHRDVKPDNLMLTSSGQVKVLRWSCCCARCSPNAQKHAHRRPKS